MHLCSASTANCGVNNAVLLTERNSTIKALILLPGPTSDKGGVFVIPAKEFTQLSLSKGIPFEPRTLQMLKESAAMSLLTHKATTETLRTKILSVRTRICC
jgi:hypothetical protein